MYISLDKDAGNFDTANLQEQLTMLANNYIPNTASYNYDDDLQDRLNEYVRDSVNNALLDQFGTADSEIYASTVSNQKTNYQNARYDFDVAKNDLFEEYDYQIVELTNYYQLQFFKANYPTESIHGELPLPTGQLSLF